MRRTLALILIRLTGSLIVIITLALAGRAWIEASYHRRRRQRALGRLTPVEFEAIMTTPAAAAA